MIQLHSLVLDDALPFPETLRDHALSLDYKGEVGPDGVEYPNISSNVPRPDVDQLYRVLGYFLGRPPEPCLPPFFRLSLADTQPPHWAHTDAELSKFLGVLYLSAPRDCRGKDGTHIVEHVLGMTEHPRDEVERAVWTKDHSDRSRWTVTWTAPMRFNRLVVLPTQLFHAASPGFGTSVEDGRLVLLTFFS